jgi:hypothetical protein
MYSSINDLDRHSVGPLALSKIEARVKFITVLSLGFFMFEDFQHSLSWGLTE